MQAEFPSELGQENELGLVSYIKKLECIESSWIRSSLQSVYLKGFIAFFKPLITWFTITDVEGSEDFACGFLAFLSIGSSSKLVLIAVVKKLQISVVE